MKTEDTPPGAATFVVIHTSASSRCIERLLAPRRHGEGAQRLSSWTRVQILPPGEGVQRLSSWTRVQLLPPGNGSRNPAHGWLRLSRLVAKIGKAAFSAVGANGKRGQVYLSPFLPQVAEAMEDPNAESQRDVALATAEYDYAVLEAMAQADWKLAAAPAISWAIVSRAAARGGRRRKPGQVQFRRLFGHSRQDAVPTAQPALRRPVVDLQVRDLVEIDAVACKNSAFI